MNKTLAALGAALFAVGALAGPALAAPGGHGGGGHGGGGHIGGGGGGGGHIGGGGGFAGPRHTPHIAPPQITPPRPTYVPNVRPDSINSHRHHGHHGHHGHHRPGRVIIGAPYYYGDYYDYGPRYRSNDDACDYLWVRWKRTGNPKWKARYYRCID